MSFIRFLFPFFAVWLFFTCSGRFGVVRKAQTETGATTISLATRHVVNSEDVFGGKRELFVDYLKIYEDGEIESAEIRFYMVMLSDDPVPGGVATFTVDDEEYEAELGNIDTGSAGSKSSQTSFESTGTGFRATVSATEEARSATIEISEDLDEALKTAQQVGLRLYFEGNEINFDFSSGDCESLRGFATTRP